jgi:predicted PurR-regulated permease PerM
MIITRLEPDNYDSMDSQANAPFYQKLGLTLLSLTIIIMGLSYGKNIILPVLFAILLANILLPVTNYLKRKNFNKSISIFIPLFLFVLAGAGIVYFLSSQIIHFINDVPALQDRIDEVSRTFQQWFKETTNMKIWRQDQIIEDTVGDLKEKAPGFVGATVVSITGILTYAFLVPLYTFLILYYRSIIKSFLISVFKNGNEANVRSILTESTKVAQQYLTGLFIETTLVFALNATGFLILGIKYAIFLALLAALLNLIPYVGILVANILCMAITLVSSTEISNVLWVGIILAVVQFLDNNVGMPLIVGNKVRLNVLGIIIGVFVGGALCGIPGMFLAIPGLAVLKVVFDKVPGLEPWGMLLGDSNTDDPLLKHKVIKRLKHILKK